MSEDPSSVTVWFRLDQVVEFDAMASVDAVMWWCRFCAHNDLAATMPLTATPPTP